MPVVSAWECCFFFDFFWKNDFFFRKSVKVENLLLNAYQMILFLFHLTCVVLRKTGFFNVGKIRKIRKLKKKRFLVFRRHFQQNWSAAYMPVVARRLVIDCIAVYALGCSR